LAIVRRGAGTSATQIDQYLTALPEVLFDVAAGLLPPQAMLDLELAVTSNQDASPVDLFGEFLFRTMRIGFGNGSDTSWIQDATSIIGSSGANLWAAVKTVEEGDTMNQKAVLSKAGHCIGVMLGRCFAVRPAEAPQVADIARALAVGVFAPAGDESVAAYLLRLSSRVSLRA
jgi:hypothetical protein